MSALHKDATKNDEFDRFPLLSVRNWSQITGCEEQRDRMIRESSRRGIDNDIIAAAAGLTTEDVADILSS